MAQNGDFFAEIHQLASLLSTVYLGIVELALKPPLIQLLLPYVVQKSGEFACQVIEQGSDVH